MKFKARDYQKECLAEISKTVQAGEKRALVVMAPGLGKTITSAFAVKEFFTDREFSRVLILCHSEEILRQSKAEYQKFFGEEYSYGMFVSNEKITRQTDFLFATFQTMKDNRKDFPKEAFSYIIVDEAHHSKARTYFPTIRYFKPEFLLGLTATPDRLDGQKIEEIYGEPVYELSFVETTCRGLLAKCDYELVLDDLSQDDIDRYLDSDEKLSINQLNNTIFAPKRDEEIVRLIKKYSTEQGDPKTMIFCKSIEHARRIAKLMGDEATLVHNGQSSSTNDIALDAFREGKIRTIVSVQMLNEGIDVPDANMIVFLRNTVSPGVFYQQLGRGVRPAPGKKKVKVLDFVGNCERIQTVLELKQEIDVFRIQTPVEKTYTHGDGEADSHEKFTLNIATPEFKAREVDIIDLLERAVAGRKWTKEEVIAGLQKMYAEGKKMTVYTVNTYPGLPTVKVIARVCGTFNKALEMAGIPQNRVLVKKEREELIREGKAMLARGGKITYAAVDANPNLPAASTVTKAFGGSLKMFQDACGVVDEATHQEKVLYDFWLKSKEAGHWLSNKEIDEDESLENSGFYYRHFGKREELVSKALDTYGPILDDEEKAAQERLHNQQERERIARRYYELSAEKGYWLGAREFDRYMPERRRLCYFSKGIQELRDFAGELCGNLPNKYHSQDSDEDLIRAYREESRKVGHWLKFREVKNCPRLCSTRPYYNRFGGFQKTRQLAIEKYGDFTKENATN